MKTKTITKIEYGLAFKKIGIPLEYYISSNEGCDYCYNEQYILQTGGTDEKQWVVDNLWEAEWVRHNSTPWYNAVYQTPTHNFEPEELIVIHSFN